MKLDIVASSGNDEFYTPVYAIEPLLKYIPSNSKVWCPFDTENSNFVKELRKHGCEVILSHLETGQDFFVYEPESYDYIVSNPIYPLI